MKESALGPRAAPPNLAVHNVVVRAARFIPVDQAHSHAMSRTDVILAVVEMAVVGARRPQTWRLARSQQ